MTGPIGERTVTLREEFDRLDARLDDLAESLRDAEAGTQSGQALQQFANDAEQQLSGVAYLVEEFGPEATVTVRGLDAGAFAKVEDRTATIAASKDGPGGVPGARRNVWAATGLVDAPFLDADPDDGASEYEQKLAAVSGQPVGVAKWIEQLVSEETTVEGNWTPLSERLADTSTD